MQFQRKLWQPRLERLAVVAVLIIMWTAAKAVFPAVLLAAMLLHENAIVGAM